MAGLHCLSYLFLCKTLNVPITTKVVCFSRLLKCLRSLYGKSVDPDQTAPIGAVCSGSTLFASILNSSEMVGNYLQQTTSADNIFRRIFFAWLFFSCWFFFFKIIFLKFLAGIPDNLLGSRSGLIFCWMVCLFVCLLLYIPSQQLWSWQDGQFT